MADRPVEAVICGGGVIGAATAYALAQRGVRTLIVEADRVAAAASGYAAGLLSPPTWEEMESPLGSILRLSFDLHVEQAEVLPRESGVDYQFARSPRLFLAITEEEERAAREQVRRQRAAGMEARWLDPREARGVCDFLDGPIRGAFLGETGGQVDAQRYTVALVRAAERLGASLRIGRVRGIERDGDRVSGVRVDDTVVPTRTVVVALGPWSGEAAAWLGCPVPVEPLKGEIVRVRPLQALPLCPFSYEPEGWLPSESQVRSVTPKASGLVFLGTTLERAGFQAEPTAAAEEEFLRFGRRFASVLAEAEVVERTACLRPLVPDDLPLLGAVPGLRGAYLATGHGRKGILMAPASGRALAELIVDGRARCLDLAPFSPARFAGG